MAKKILIIGNSDGIGAAVARALVARDDLVVGVSRSESPFAHRNLRHQVHDVTSPDYPRLLERLLAEEHKVDSCIYCAGIGSELSLPDLSREPYVFEVNLMGMVRTMAVLVPAWLERREGHFVGLSSLADSFCMAGAPSYSASKAGFSNYLLAMGLRLRNKGVAVTNIRFGFVDTKMARSPRKPLLMSADEAARHVLDCLKRRPMQLSVPKIISAAASGIGTIQSVRAWTQ